MHSAVGKTVVLYSGGLDSWLVSKIFPHDVLLYVDIGTPGSKEELRRIRQGRIDENVVVEKLDISRFEVLEKNFMLPLRNLYLCMVAMNYGSNIILGSVKTDQNIDNTTQFTKLASDILTFLSPQVYGEHVSVEVSNPARSLTKKDLLKRYVMRGGSLEVAWESTMSCYSPINGKECGNCLSCRLKTEAFRELGFGKGKYNEERF